MLGYNLWEFGHIALAEPIMLHGKLLKVLVELHDTHKLWKRLTRQLVPRYIEELELRVVDVGENVPADVISHLTFV